MTTLAEQLETDYTALVLTPQYDEPELERVSELAAARVIRHGGLDDGTDTAAVDVGLDYMIHLVQKRFALMSDEIASSEARRIDAMFADFRAGRQQEAGTPYGDTVTPATDAADQAQTDEDDYQNKVRAEYA